MSKKSNNRISSRATKDAARIEHKIPEQAVKHRHPQDKKWEFSFEHWTQRELFGLGSVSREWFISLLERLKNLSSKSIEEVISDQRTKSAFRIHKISWNYCPIQKSSFDDLIPSEYRGEETDVIQFQVEKSKGRVIGYLDFNNTFQIILLDSEHNMQLSQYNNYTVVETSVLPDSYQSMKTKLVGVLSRAERLKESSVQGFIRDVQNILLLPSDSVGT